MSAGRTTILTDGPRTRVIETVHDPVLGHSVVTVTSMTGTTIIDIRKVHAEGDGLAVVAHRQQIDLLEALHFTVTEDEAWLTSTR